MDVIKTPVAQMSCYLVTYQHCILKFQCFNTSLNYFKNLKPQSCWQNNKFHLAYTVYADLYIILASTQISMLGHKHIFIAPVVHSKSSKPAQELKCWHVKSSYNRLNYVWCWCFPCWRSLHQDSHNNSQLNQLCKHQGQK